MKRLFFFLLLLTPHILITQNKQIDIKEDEITRAAAKTCIVNCVIDIHNKTTTIESKLDALTFTVCDKIENLDSQLESRVDQLETLLGSLIDNLLS